MSTIDLALLIVRVVLGVIFIIHGGQKLFSWYDGPGIKGTSQWLASFEVAHPTPLAWMVALSEFGGGLLLLLGLLTPLGAAITIGVMLVAIVQVHAKNGLLNTNQGYEFNLSLITLALVLLLLGAGTVSIDHLLGLTGPLDEWPTGIAVVLLLIPFSGFILTELSRAVKTAPGVNSEQTTMKRR